MRLKGHAVSAATKRSTTKSIHLVEREVKRYLRTYTHPKGTPTPSPPGGPPAMITGNLIRSQKVTSTRKLREGVYGARTGPTARYGRAQELGGRVGRDHRTTLPKRPFQKPVTRAALRRIRGIYRDAWREALKA